VNIHPLSLKKTLLPLNACLREAASAKAGGRIKEGVMTKAFPPHPNPLPPGERENDLFPQQSWGSMQVYFYKRKKDRTRTISNRGGKIGMSLFCTLLQE
jgi:hypothetical protein